MLIDNRGQLLFLSAARFLSLTIFSIKKLFSLNDLLTATVRGSGSLSSPPRKMPLTVAGSSGNDKRGQGDQTIGAVDALDFQLINCTQF